MWREPYLETCCRSALHRVVLAADLGRPGDVADRPCLERLREMGLIRMREDWRFCATQAGEARHRTEILRDS